MATNSKDSVLVASLVLSVVSLVLLIMFGVTWYFQASLSLLQQQVEYDRELLVKLQEQVNVRPIINVLDVKGSVLMGNLFYCSYCLNSITMHISMNSDSCSPNYSNRVYTY